MNTTYKKPANWGYLLIAVPCTAIVALSPLASSLAAEVEHGQAALETVTVTAQRREEDSQSVPIAINTISGEDLAVRGADSFQTLFSAVPNLTVTGLYIASTYIRGVGSSSGSPNNEASVATYIDGVYMPSAFGLTSLAFSNLERMEVLKGPQGTLFGRNATAGVIQLITPDPKHELGGNVSLGYGNYEAFSGKGYLTGGITENLAADVTVLYEDQNAGWGYNPAFQKEINGIEENISVRSKWLYTPSDATKVTVILDYNHFESDMGNVQMLPGSFAAADHVTTYPGKYNSLEEPAVYNSEQHGASVRIDHDFGAVHGASITAYRNVTAYSSTDQDLTPARLSLSETWNDSDYLMQEFQLSNASPGKIEWLVGAFLYGNEISGADPRRDTGPSVNPGGFRQVWGEQKGRSYSAFGQATMEVFADTKLTLGLRYTDETAKADGRINNQAGGIISGPFHDEVNFDPFTWRVALDHQFTPDVLGYVSYNRGFKSGGYNLISPGTAPFDPETVDAYEIGMKSEFFDRRVRLNAAVFYYDYRNLQVAIAPGGGGQIFTNAAAARNYGLDLSLDVAATDNLTLSLGLGLLSAEYTDYPDATGRLITGAAFPIANAKGAELPYSPPISGFVSANYNVPTSIGDIRATANLSYLDRTYISPDNLPKKPEATMLSGSLEWWSQSASPIGVRLWGKNLLDTYYVVQMVESANGYYQSLNAPRTYGVTLLKNF